MAATTTATILIHDKPTKSNLMLHPNQGRLEQIGDVFGGEAA